MNKVTFGKTGLEITPIGFGAWAIGGGDWDYGWGPQQDADSIAAIHKALDNGINWIDTAAIYGLGYSEEIVAKALAGMSEKPLVFTKCSLVWDDKREITSNQKADSIRQDCEDSLRRLQTDAIDLYQVHWPTPEDDIEEGWEALAALKKEGKVRHIGVSNYSVAQMERIKQYGDVETLQPPYSLVKPEVEAEILPYCGENNIGVIVYSPMYSGLLTGKMTRERIENFPDNDWRKDNEEFQEPKLTRNLAMVEVLKAIGEKHGKSPAEVSIAWTLNNPNVTAAIVGARNPRQVDGIVGAAEFRLNEDDLAQINDFLATNPA